MVIITDGLPAHKLAFNQIDLEKENIVVHYLEAHSSDQLQPLDLAIFGGTKSKSNIENLSSFTSNVFSTKLSAAFKSAGMVVQIQFKNGQITEQMGFDVEKCVKVRGYELSYIQDLVQKGFELTPNQLIIYQKSI
ncbi:hypothetical protein M9Y10_002651 [Tritrichomonas musculus]|uniref:DDE-1 domain-containing protein n=1 Tax=Tritrichomonas musculus TaxID=1915356 RepID=A0ABR2LAR5_9EUKA